MTHLNPQPIGAGASRAAEASLDPARQEDDPCWNESRVPRTCWSFALSAKSRRRTTRTRWTRRRGDHREWDEIRFVYVLGDDFDGYSVAAGWEDTKLGIGHVSKWKRIAVVTNHDWTRHTVGMFGWMLPGNVKVFPLQEQAAAMEWAAG